MMNSDDAIDRLTPQALDENFKRRARLTSRDAADSLLARGRTVSYREQDTPAGHVVRRHPDGRIETVKIDLGSATSARQSA
ncbi:hypothetical protein [uncultured Sphingomonas sp.]|uniref:hypothetical protein n=1 Tax=uncultured Sphingomonas sp. TaxID=158754 RepID=UPI0035CC53EC